MTERRRVHIIVKGRVQGVSFRAYTRQLAVSLGLVGFAHNLADGSVEIEAQGRNQDIAQLCDWVKHGPPSARIDVCTIQELPLKESLTQFEIG